MTRVLLTLFCLLTMQLHAAAQDGTVPSAALPVRNGLEQAQWMGVQEGLEVIRTLTPDGVVFTGYRISPKHFTFAIRTQLSETGSRAKEIGEQEGAVIVSNGGFFAVTGSGRLYPVGYFRMNGEVRSKGWHTAGGVVSFIEGQLRLSPTHAGIPSGEFDAFQSRPMLIEPGGKWAMGSNGGISKVRTLLCTLETGDVILAVVSRAGMTLYEAGWLMRSRDEGGFFGCDAAIALDGGRSTQIWHAGEPQYSVFGATPVYSFLVVRQRED
ncbi:MAG: phosphodiester glycosidase family protein [Pseudomonadota bacterium]